MDDLCSIICSTIQCDRTVQPLQQLANQIKCMGENGSDMPLYEVLNLFQIPWGYIIMPCPQKRPVLIWDFLALREIKTEYIGKCVDTDHTYVRFILL